MALVLDKQRRMLSLGDGQIELQEWKVYREGDNSFEYHMYVGHNFDNHNNGKRMAKGAIWMLFRITNPDGEDADQTTEYRMGRSGLPGSPTDTIATEWAGRVAATYYRYDQILTTFFNG